MVLLLVLHRAGDLTGRRRGRVTVAYRLVRRDLGEWAAQWDALVVAHRPSPFLAAAWLDAVADDATRIVLAVDGDGRLLGGFPFQLSSDGRRRLVTVAGAPLAPDHVDVVGAPDHVDDVAATVWRWLRDENVRRFDLHGLVAGSRLAARLDGHDRLESVAPWAVLPPTFDDYWAARPGQLRSTVRRAETRLARAGVEYQRVPPADAASALRDYFALHASRFGDASAVIPAQVAFERACRPALDAGLLVAHRLTDGQRAVAVELWFEHGRTASFYQSGRDPDPA